MYNLWTKYFKRTQGASVKSVKFLVDDSCLMSSRLCTLITQLTLRLFNTAALTQHVINKKRRVTCEGLTLRLIEKASIICSHFTWLSTCCCVDEVTLWTGSRQLNLDRLTQQNALCSSCLPAFLQTVLFSKTESLFREQLIHNNNATLIHLGLSLYLDEWGKWSQVKNQFQWMLEGKKIKWGLTICN